jgi:hypothetical protein
MFNITEVPVWAQNVEGWDPEDFVEGGPLGVDNVPLKQLANRTAYLKSSLLPRIVGTYIESGVELDPWELAKYRLLEPYYQLIEIADYPELCARKYCGDANNNTARWWYKCDQAGNRTITGTHMRVEDRRGLFPRSAGANAAVQPSIDALYDGNSLGSFEGFGSMGSPDYAAGQTIAVLDLTTEDYVWTATQDGFFVAHISRVPTAGGVLVFIDNAPVVDTDYNERGGPRMYTPLLPIKKDQVVRICGSEYSATAYFYPPINDRGSISVNYYIVY